MVVSGFSSQFISKRITAANFFASQSQICQAEAIAIDFKTYQASSCTNRLLELFQAKSKPAKPDELGQPSQALLNVTDSSSAEVKIYHTSASLICWVVALHPPPNPLHPLGHMKGGRIFFKDQFSRVAAKKMK